MILAIADWIWFVLGGCSVIFALGVLGAAGQYLSHRDRKRREAEREAKGIIREPIKWRREDIITWVNWEFDLVMVVRPMCKDIIVFKACGDGEPHSQQVYSMMKEMWRVTECIQYEFPMVAMNMRDNGTLEWAFRDDCTDFENIYLYTRDQLKEVQDLLFKSEMHLK